MMGQKQTNDSTLLGLIAAMKDGWVSGFEHRGVYVHRVGESMGISPEGPPQDIQGGRLLIASADVAEATEWIENKADLYGDN